MKSHIEKYAISLQKKKETKGQNELKETKINKQMFERTPILNILWPTLMMF